MPSVFLQFILSGLTTGAVYALVGLGFNIIYNTTSIINLAQGEFVVAGGLLMWFYVESLKVPNLMDTDPLQKVSQCSLLELLSSSRHSG